MPDQGRGVSSHFYADREAQRIHDRSCESCGSGRTPSPQDEPELWCNYCEAWCPESQPCRHVAGRSPSPGLAHLAASLRSQERGIGHLLRAREIEAVARWIESSPSGDFGFACPVFMRGDDLTCAEPGGTMPDGRQRRCTQPKGHDATRQSHTYEFLPVPDAVWEAASARAKAEGTTVTAVILAALTRYAKGYKP